MNMIVRPATSADVPALAASWKDTYQDFLEATPTGFGGPMRTPDAGDWQAPWLEKILAELNHIVLVAERSRTVLGFTLGEIKRENDDFFEAPYLKIFHLSVDRSARRSGIGRALMERMEAIARERGMKALDLDVPVRSNPAIRLYESLGLTPLTKRMAKLLEP